MPLVLDTLVYADRQLLRAHPALALAQVYVHFQSSVKELDTVEYWGVLGDRSTWPKGPTSILLRMIYAVVGWPPSLEAQPADLSIDLPSELLDVEEAIRQQQEVQQRRRMRTRQQQQQLKQEQQLALHERSEQVQREALEREEEELELVQTAFAYAAESIGTDGQQRALAAGGREVSAAEDAPLAEGLSQRWPPQAHKHQHRGPCSEAEETSTQAGADGYRAVAGRDVGLLGSCNGDRSGAAGSTSAALLGDSQGTGVCSGSTSSSTARDPDAESGLSNSSNGHGAAGSDARPRDASSERRRGLAPGEMLSVVGSAAVAAAGAGGSAPGSSELAPCSGQAGCNCGREAADAQEGKPCAGEGVAVVTAAPNSATAAAAAAAAAAAGGLAAVATAAAEQFGRQGEQLLVVPSVVQVDREMEMAIGRVSGARRSS